MKRQFIDWWNKLPTRQHKLLLVALLICCAGVGDLVLLTPQSRVQRRLQGQYNNLQTQLFDAQTAADARAAEDKRLHEEEANLRQRLTEAETQIAQASKALVNSESLRGRIRELTGRGEGVRLVELSTLPIEPVSLVAGGATTRAERNPADGSATLYRLNVSVTVEGNYPALRAYLSTLEQSQLGLRWSSVSLDNKHWPAVRMELNLFMLSDKPVWRGR